MNEPVDHFHLNACEILNGLIKIPVTRYDYLCNPALHPDQVRIVRSFIVKDAEQSWTYEELLEKKLLPVLEDLAEELNRFESLKAWETGYTGWPLANLAIRSWLVSPKGKIPVRTEFSYHVNTAGTLVKIIVSVEGSHETI